MHMADGRPFGRRFSINRISKFTMEIFTLINDWAVKSMDPGKLMQVYNRPMVLIHLDPAYLSSWNKYKHSSKREDLEYLVPLMRSH